TPGTYTVAVEVTDHPQNFASCTRTGSATVVVGDGPPVADSGGPYFCNANATIQLDGSGSHSTPPGHTIRYGWDLDNDGQFNDSTVVKPSFTCGTVNGTMYSVCLRVTATSGLDDTDCTTVTIGQP